MFFLHLFLLYGLIKIIIFNKGKMLNRFVKNYYKLFDEKLKNWTVIVLIIAFLIASVWNVTHASWKEKQTNNYLKANILEINTWNEYIKVNWKTYKLVD